MSAPDEILDSVLDVINEMPNVDGHGAWREVGPLEWQRICEKHTHAVAYIEISTPGDEIEIAHLVADPDPEANKPVFDDGAAADRAREIALDCSLGVTP